MTSLLANTTEVAAWVDQVKKTYSGNHVFGKIVGSVIWTDQTGQDGTSLVSADPQKLVTEINTTGMPLFKGHDPGFPVGRVLAAQIFDSPRGTRFVAAVIGFYEGGERLSFRDIGVDSTPPVSSPRQVDELGADCWLDFQFEPREVEAKWVDDVIRDSPLRVELTELSHNAAEPSVELIRVGLVFLALVWNPFVTSVATAAGKQVYEDIHRWLRTLWKKLAERNNPVVVVTSHQYGCQVSFIFRSKEVKINYAAHEALPTAAAQAAMLLTNMKARGFSPQSLTYEFDPKSEMWFPLYAFLPDGRIVCDLNILVAFEQLPSQLSLGISRNKDMPRIPE